MRAAYGLRDLPNSEPLGFLAGNCASHELEHAVPGLLLGWKDAQPLTAHRDAITAAHQRHRQACGRFPFHVDHNAAVHLLIVHVDPLAIETNLRAVACGAVESVRECTADVRDRNLTILGRERHGAVIVDGLHNLSELLFRIGSNLNVRMALVGLTLADADVRDNVVAAPD